MSVEETHMQEENAPIPSPKRGYWAGWKDVRHIGQFFYWFIIFVCLNTVADRLLDSMVDKEFWKSYPGDVTTWKIIITITEVGSI